MHLSRVRNESEKRERSARDAGCRCHYGATRCVLFSTLRPGEARRLTKADDPTVAVLSSVAVLSVACRLSFALGLCWLASKRFGSSSRPSDRGGRRFISLQAFDRGYTLHATSHSHPLAPVWVCASSSSSPSAITPSHSHHFSCVHSYSPKTRFPSRPSHRCARSSMHTVCARFGLRLSALTPSRGLAGGAAFRTFGLLWVSASGPGRGC